MIRLLLALALAAILPLAARAAAPPTPLAVRIPGVIEDRRLNWAPPALRDPIRLEAPVGNFAPKLAPGRDYLITCPRERSGDLMIVGDPKQPPRNIVLIGCRMHGRLVARYFSGVFHGEGLFIAPGRNADGFDCGGSDGPTGICRLQNVRITGLVGSKGGYHADCVQPWGPVAGFQIDRLTCDTNYQGLFLAPRSWFDFAVLLRINLRDNGIPNADGNPGALYWFMDTDQSGTRDIRKPDSTIVCISCYGRVRAGFTFLARGVYPSPGTTIVRTPVDPVGRQRNHAVCWADPTRIFGNVAPGGACEAVIAGDPPRGDFVPESIGYSYTSPGYRPRPLLAAWPVDR
jgi:hypothetical protein